MEVMSYSHLNNPYAAPWDPSQVYTANNHNLDLLMKRQLDLASNTTTQNKKVQQVPEIMTNGQLGAQYAVYAHPYSYPSQPPQLSSSPMTSNLSSDSSSVVTPGLLYPNGGSPSPSLSASGLPPHHNQNYMYHDQSNLIPPGYGYNQMSQQGGYMTPVPSLPGTPSPSNGVLPSSSSDQHQAESPSSEGPNMMTGSGFSPSMMAMQHGGQPNVPTGRTVYVGNLPNTASVDELLSLVRFGPIESVKILPEKSCAFISFLDPNIASAFHSDIIMRKIQLHDHELRVGWGKPTAISHAVLHAVTQDNACRNVFIGNLDADMTEAELRDSLSRYGPIDQVKIVRDKNIGFVHFLSIATAMKVVESLTNEAEWYGKRVSYGKDRCAYVPKNQQQQQQHNLNAAAMAASYTGNFGQISSNFSQQMGLNHGVMAGQENNMLLQAGNRTIYLGNLHPETTIEEICNSIRGGVLQQIRFLPDKHICFITFVDPNAALAFFSTAVQQGIVIHNRRLKVGYGKHSGPPLPGIAMCVQNGGSRNVYIGGIDDLEVFTEERLRRDFGQYGEIEMVNILKDKNCGFVNFTDIANAIKAIEAIKHQPEYAAFKVAFGKDRCGNAPRYGYFNNGHGGKHSPSRRRQDGQVFVPAAPGDAPLPDAELQFSSPVDAPPQAT